MESQLGFSWGTDLIVQSNQYTKYSKVSNLLGIFLRVTSQYKGRKGVSIGIVGSD